MPKKSTANAADTSGADLLLDGPLYGDLAGDTSSNKKLKGQVLQLEDVVGGTAYGDAGGAMNARSKGGNDTLLGGGDGASNVLFGDAHEMHDNARGGDEVVHPEVWKFG